MKTICELRKITGLSQSQFAEKYHINIHNVRNWEQGRRNCLPWVQYLLERVITELDYKKEEK